MFKDDSPPLNGGAASSYSISSGSRPSFANPGLKKFQVGNIARMVFELYNLTPPLANAAARLDIQAQNQTGVVTKVSAQADALTRTLDASVEKLDVCVKHAFQSLRLIREITGMAKILAINASVEAARAGEAGRPFGIIAAEMSQLAEQTATASQHLTETLGDMQKKVGDVVNVAGGKTGSSSENSCSVLAMTKAFHEVQRFAESQRREAHQLLEMSEKSRHISENLLLDMGRLRFEIHARSEAAVTDLMTDPRLSSGVRNAVEAALLEAARNHPFFDLLYVTDSRGIQFTRNVGHDAHQAGSGMDAVGRNWSQRPWFLRALQEGGPVTSDLYLSVATRRFCFTVSQAIGDEHGRVAGVLGVDVDFEKLLTP